MSTMSTMAENVIAVGSKNRPPMLERRTTTTPATTRERTLDDLTPEEKICKACDVNATNIILQGLPHDVYSLLNHHTNAKELLDRVKLLMKGSELSLQERESKLYNEFDKFTSKKGETIHSYHLLFVKLINDMNIIGMTMRPLQVNIKFVNHLQLEWSKFVTDVKSNDEAKISRFSCSGLAVLKFLPTNDPIESLNKAIAFLSTAITSRYPQTNNQLRTSSNLRNQSTIQDGRNSEWLKEKMLLAQAQEAKVVLDEEQLAFLADTGERVDSGIDARALTTTAIFQIDDLDAFDSDCDEACNTPKLGRSGIRISGACYFIDQ
ncbi:hypothetical protein Tco_0290684 [Tanacetum coccineum]